MSKVPSQRVRMDRTGQGVPGGEKRDRLGGLRALPCNCPGTEIRSLIPSPGPVTPQPFTEFLITTTGSLGPGHREGKLALEVR